MSGSARDTPSADVYSFVLNHCREFLTLINRDYVYEVANDSYCAALEKSRDEIIGASVAEIWGADLFESSLKGYLDRCLAGEHVSYIEKFQFGAEKRYMNVNYYPYPRPDGNATHVLVSSHDITNLGELEAMLMNYEYRDPVTGLFNRKSLEVLLEVELLKAQRGADTTRRALFFIDIENLPEISRRHGYDIGDYVLENTAVRVKELVRDSDYVFRFRGNELALILSHLAQESDVERVATKIVQAVTTPYRLYEAVIAPTCRIGAAVYPHDARSSEEMLRNAATALADAVRDDQEFKRFDREANRRTSHRISMESSLRRAFEREQFELYFQPIVRARGGIEGAEALIRWNLPDRGIVRPGEFLPIAEESGMMDSISRWAIFSAVRHLRQIWERYPIYLSVNMTAKDFESADLLEILRAALGQTNGQVSPNCLKLEITETDAMRRHEAAVSRMNALQEQGFEVYIDDFGTGHSSLAYLRSLPASTIKIDKSFIDTLAADAAEAPFVKYIIDLLKIRGKRVVAEGVTTAEQVERLREMGCDSFQGFYFAEPLPFSAFERFLERQPLADL